MTEKDSGEFFKVQRTFAQLSHRYSQVIFHQFRRFGIHPGQMPLLMLLDQNDGLNQSEICRKLRIKPSTAAVSLQRMEKNGLIFRASDERDQRKNRIYATDKAKAIWKEIRDLMCENNQVLMQGISMVEICLLQRLLEQIYKNMDNLQTPEMTIRCCGQEEETYDD